MEVAQPTLLPTDIVKQEPGNYTNLVFNGGGALCIAHVGVLEELNKRGMLTNMINYAGSSAGSIIAAGMACGSTIENIKLKLMSLKLEKLQDDSWFIGKNIMRVYKEYGYCKGEALYEWIGKMMNELVGDPDYTFSNLKNELIITGTDLNTASTIYYSKKNTPDMPIRLAVRISCSFPLVYRTIKDESNKHVLIDGGLLNNYPINVFDSTSEERNPHTLGVKLYTNREIPGKPTDINNFYDFVKTMIYAVYDQSLRIYVRKSDWKRTIKVNVGNFTAMDFSISNEDKETLVELGKKAVNDFMSGS